MFYGKFQSFNLNWGYTQQGIPGTTQINLLMSSELTLW